MGLAQVGVDAVAGAAAFPNHLADADADSGGVDDASAGAVAAAEGALTFGDALHGDGFALPAVKANDPIGLSDRLPALYVGDLGAALLTLIDLGAIKRR
jgi:hypothetical protein